jgi:hypothetical protein
MRVLREIHFSFLRHQQLFLILAYAKKITSPLPDSIGSCYLLIGEKSSHFTSTEALILWLFTEGFVYRALADTGEAR